jgi:muramoyltetrapeptide carboxypeptidase
MLQVNDRVAIIAPAAQFRTLERELLDQAVNLLKRWSLQVDVLVEHDHYFYLAGSDELRQKHLNQALMNDDYKAIFCTRGGYGSTRLLNKLPAVTQVSKKILIGYSDITSLHLAMATNFPQVSCVHGPNVATQQLLAQTASAIENQAALHAALFEQRTHHYDIKMLKPGQGQGRLLGGCLSVLCAAIGSAHMPSFEGAILLLEDVGEAPYKIDRMLNQLCHAGIMDVVSAVVFGDMYQCTDPYNDLSAVILDVLSDYDIPIAFGLKSGHGPLNYAVALNSHAYFDNQQQKLIVHALA